MKTETIGDAVLHMGDCRDVLAGLGTVHAVVTDPPYGISYKTNYRKRLATPEMLNGDEDAPLWFLPLAEPILADGGAVYVCTRFDVAPEWMAAIRGCGLELKTPIVWDKTNHTAGDLEGDYGNQTELVLFAHKGRHLLRHGRDVNLWRIPRPPAGDHPTPKPVDLMARMIRNSTDHGDTVLDPFMGSGATGVAAVKQGRRFIGIEIEQKYFDMSCRRIEEAAKQSDLFVQPIAPPTQATLDYDAADDSKKSWEVCLDAVRTRKAAGGPGWEPK
jgi:site-specific DNA-methyltransferase (adenine-specific)